MQRQARLGSRELAYHCLVTLLGDALEAVYRSRWSFRTMRAVGVTEDETHRLWVVRPGRLRGEHDGRGGTSTIVRSGPLWWRWHQDHGGMFGDDREVGLVTLEPSPTSLTPHLCSAPLVWKRSARTR